MKEMQTMPGADTDSDHNLQVVKMCMRLKKIIKFQKGKPRWALQKLHAQWQKVQDTLQEQLGAIECESGNVEMQWNHIRKCVLDTMSDLVGKADRKAREPWITQEMINKMLEHGKRKNVDSKEGRKSDRRLRNILRAYVVRSWNFKEQDVTITMKELCWKVNCGIQNIGIEESKVNIIVDKGQVLKIWTNYITELYNIPNQPEKTRN
jgi:hypothetical protein